MVTSPSGPVRTCVGCRDLGSRDDLLRVTLQDGVLTVDERGQLPGRGARLHPDLACLDVAAKRRAFNRAFRVKGELDVGPIRKWITD